MIAQEEKIKRRNILEKNSNITDAGFGGRNRSKN